VASIAIKSLSPSIYDTGTPAVSVKETFRQVFGILPLKDTKIKDTYLLTYIEIVKWGVSLKSALTVSVAVLKVAALCRVINIHIHIHTYTHTHECFAKMAAFPAGVDAAAFRFPRRHPQHETSVSSANICKTMATSAQII